VGVALPHAGDAGGGEAGVAQEEAHPGGCRARTAPTRGPPACHPPDPLPQTGPPQATTKAGRQLAGEENRVRQQEAHKRWGIPRPVKKGTAVPNILVAAGPGKQRMVHSGTTSDSVGTDA
jgi:hypothetical protein